MKTLFLTIIVLVALATPAHARDGEWPTYNEDRAFCQKVAKEFLDAGDSNKSSDKYIECMIERRQYAVEQLKAKKENDAAKEEAYFKAQSEALERQVREDEARKKARQTAIKKQCGTDYHRPRVGMTLDRANQCIGQFRMVGQINRKDGALVSTYELGGGYIHVIDGKISAWQAPH